MNNSWNDTVLEIKEGTKKVEVSLSYGQMIASNIEAISAHLVAPFKRYLELLNIQGMPLPKVKQSLKGCVSVYDTRTAYGQNHSAGGITFYRGKTKPYYWEAYVYQSTQGPPGFETDQWRVHNLEHEFSHGLLFFLLGDYHWQLNAIFTEGMAEYLAHGSQCRHFSGVARKQHEKQLDLLSIIQPIQGEEVYSIGFLVMAYMIEETPEQWVKLIKAFQRRQDQQVQVIFSSFAKAQQSNFKYWLTRKAGIFESQKHCPIVLPQNNLSNTAHPNLTTFCEVNTLDTHHRHETELKQKAHVAELLKHLNQEEVSPEIIKTMITNRANQDDVISKMYENVFALEVLTLVKHKKLSTLEEVLDLTDRRREKLLSQVALEISKSSRVLKNEEGKAVNPFEKVDKEAQEAIDETIHFRDPKEGEIASRLKELNQNKHAQAILSLLKVDLKRVQDILDKRSNRPEIVSRMCDNLYSPEVRKLVEYKKLNTLYGVLNLTEQSCIELTAQIAQKAGNSAKKPSLHRNEAKIFPVRTSTVQKKMDFSSLGKNKEVNQMMNPKTGQMTSERRHERIMQWRKEVNKQQEEQEVQNSQQPALLKEWSEDLVDVDVVIDPSRKMGAFAHPLDEEFQMAAEHSNENKRTIKKLDDRSIFEEENSMDSNSNGIWIEEAEERGTVRGASVQDPWVLTGIEEAEDVPSSEQESARAKGLVWKGKNVQQNTLGQWDNTSRVNPINHSPQGKTPFEAAAGVNNDLWTEEGDKVPSSYSPHQPRNVGRRVRPLNPAHMIPPTNNDPVDNDAQEEQKELLRRERFLGRVPPQTEYFKNTGNKASPINRPPQGKASLGSKEVNNDDLWTADEDKGSSNPSSRLPRRVGRNAQPLNPSHLMPRTNPSVNDYHAQTDKQNPPRRERVLGEMSRQEEKFKNTGNKASPVNPIKRPPQGKIPFEAAAGVNNDLWTEEGDKVPSSYSPHQPRNVGRRARPLNPAHMIPSTNNNSVNDHHAQTEKQNPPRKDSVFEVSQFDAQRSTNHQIKTALPLHKEFKQTVSFEGDSQGKVPANEMPSFTMPGSTSFFSTQGKQKKTTYTYDGQKNIHHANRHAVSSRSSQNAIDTIEDNQSLQEEQFKALFSNNPSIQKALKTAKLTTWGQFQEKIKAKNNSDQSLTSKTQEAFENLQFPKLNDFVSKRWLSCSALLTMTSVQREKFIEFPERISEIQESNESAQGVLKKYQGQLNTTEGLLDYWYKPTQSRALSIEDCYAPLEALIQVLNSESRCLKILENTKKGGLSDEMHDIMGKKSQGAKNAKTQQTAHRQKRPSFFKSVVLAGASDRKNRFERKR